MFHDDEDENDLGDLVAFYNSELYMDAADDEEGPEQHLAQRRYDAAIKDAIRRTPIKGPDDLAGQLARNQALDELRGGRCGNPVAGGRLASDDPDFAGPADTGCYDPKPATGFKVERRGRLSKAERMLRLDQLTTRSRLDKIVAQIRTRMSGRKTPQRDLDVGTMLQEARSLIERGGWDHWIASIPLARSASFAMLTKVKSPKNI